MHTPRSKIDSLGRLAMEHLQSNRHAECQSLVIEILKINPQELNALQLHGYLLSVRGEFIAALEIFKKIENIHPNETGNLINLGKCNYELKKYKDAVNSYLKVLKIKPSSPEILMDIGSAYKKLGNFEESIRFYDLASKQGANNVDILLNKSNLLLQMGDVNNAKESCESLINSGFQNVNVLNTYGNILSELRIYDKSLECFEKAISLEQENAEAWAGKGNLYFKNRNYDKAIVAYETAIKLNSNDYVTHANLGYIFLQLGLIESARTSFLNALERHKDFENLFGIYIYTKLLACDWLNIDAELKEFILKLGTQDELAANPFTLLAVIDDSKLLMETAERWVKLKYPLQDNIAPEYIRNNSKIKIGYYSADFRQHPVAQSIVSMLEHHNKSQFEIFAFSYEDDDSILRKRIISACDKFIDAKDLSDREIVSLSRELKIDIAIDLGGHTQNNRMGVFALKAAPVQINYLGYPGTSGANFFDYIIADRFIAPLESEKFYTEKIAHLPSYHPKVGNRELPNLTLTREQFGIKQESFVYCCFNNSYKISPSQLDIWAEILKQTNHSVLWLFESNNQVLKNLISEFKKRGISSEKLHFTQRLEKYSDHLGRYKLADIFLDTFPYCAHTTISDAIWSGLPVITKKGKSFQSRVAYSVLEMMGLQSCAVDSDHDYISLASKLAMNPSQINSIKNIIEINKNKLTDVAQYTLEFELLYKKIISIYSESKNTRSIQVEDYLK